jgi:CheY-like chemotaxis protein
VTDYDDLRNNTFLYVEDDPLSCEVMRLIMENALGIQKLTVLPDSEHFLEALHSLTTPPTILLLDINVHPHNGFEMLKMVRSDPTFRHVRVIALTASAVDEELDQLRLSGFDSAIAKPLNGEAVWHAI